MTKPVECMLIGGPLNGRRGPIFGNDHTVQLEVYAADGSVASVELYALGDNPTPTFRHHVGTKLHDYQAKAIERIAGSFEPGSAACPAKRHSTDPVLDEALQQDAAYIAAMGGDPGPTLDEWPDPPTCPVCDVSVFVRSCSNCGYEKEDEKPAAKPNVWKTGS